MRAATISLVHPARIIIGLALALIPAATLAQGASSGTTTVPVDSGMLLLHRLETLAEGAMPLDQVVVTTKERDAWAAEVKRYTERSIELRSRCHEELRKTNRDTIALKAAQCLRSDVLLEATHRRKQRDAFVMLRGVPETIIADATKGIDAWLDAATAIVDGIDTNVFTTVDALKTAKKNLHTTYRVPMHAAFARVRIEHGLAILRSTASAVLTSLHGSSHPLLEAFVPCMESARDAFSSDVGLSTGTSQLRACAALAQDSAE